MRYVRISLMKPLSGREPDAQRLNVRLATLYASLEGCLESHALTAADGSGELGRVGLWESPEAADRAANHEDSLALRSRLHLLVKKGHRERSFYTE